MGLHRESPEVFVGVAAKRLKAIAQGFSPGLIEAGKRPACPP